VRSIRDRWRLTNISGQATAHGVILSPAILGPRSEVHFLFNE
jgi:hypothetical protein